jgi:glycyl-tRNA synthetase beta chain
MSKARKTERSGDLLVEIGVEELPARFVPGAMDQLKSVCEEGLRKAKLASKEVRVLATPRRLAVLVDGLAGAQWADTQVFLGPPRRVAVDGDGNYTKAAQGFAKKVGARVDELGWKDSPKGEVLAYERFDEGRPAADVLPAGIASWIESLTFPKSMAWSDSGFRFARPIRWLLVLLGEEELPVEVAGVRSGRSTWGHRFTHGEVRIKSPGDYVAALKGAGVLVDPEERRAVIEQGLERECAGLGGSPVRDEGLLKEVIFLVELPTVVAGSFDPTYTSMPRDVVVAAMREHQRYFAVQKDDGSLLPNFITVLNTGPDAVAGAIKGNERVLEARLADAKFYWKLDTGKSFELLLEGLEGVTWHAGFGTLRDKSSRLSELAGELSEKWCPDAKPLVQRAALYCKADLASDMVKDGKEFTGLQGAIGGEYAANWGEPTEVALAIREHYLPRFAADDIPRSMGGAVLSVVDRLDNIAGGFAAGVAPTGSEDPYALRRAANGIIRILLEKELHVSMEGLFGRACDLLSGFHGVDPERLKGELLDYWVSRGDSYFAEKDVPYDIADAVLSVSFDDPVDSWSRCAALRSFRQDQDFSALVIGFKRAANILKNTEEGADLEVKEEDLTHEAELELRAAAEAAFEKVQTALSRTDYEGAIQAQLELRPAIDRFFDGVLVMDEDQKVRAVRLALLRRVQGLFLKTWDLSRIALEA